MFALQPLRLAHQPLKLAHQPFRLAQQSLGCCLVCCVSMPALRFQLPQILEILTRLQGQT